jgi:hypothetical protein
MARGLLSSLPQGQATGFAPVVNLSHEPVTKASLRPTAARLDSINHGVRINWYG